MKTISVEEAQARIAEIIAALSPGEEVLLTRDGQPVARLIAAAHADPHGAGWGKGATAVISDDDDQHEE